MDGASSAGDAGPLRTRGSAGCCFFRFRCPRPRGSRRGGGGSRRDGDGPSDRACGEERRLTTTVKELASTWKPGRGAERGRGGQEEEPGVVGRGKKTRSASKESSARQYRQGCIVADHCVGSKKKNHLRNWAFPQAVDAQFLPLLLALDKTSATLGDTCGRCFVGSKFHLASKWNFKILPGLKHDVFLQRQFFLVSPHAKVKSWGQRVDEMELLKLWRVCSGRTDGVA